MGVWRSTMPLLSTLAAVVIIVHSAEELDPGFRRDLRPRAEDPGTTSYEQPWKSIDAEPLGQQSTHADVWGDDDSLEEQTARRRPVRKRKRRPQTSSENEPDDIQRESPQGSYPEKDNQDSHDSHQSDSARRRRKRPDIRPYRWANEPIERPLRRRGLRRKRPTIETNPRLSEFDSWSPNLTNTKEENQDKHPIRPITEHGLNFFKENHDKASPALDYYDPDPTVVDYNVNEEDVKDETYKEKGQAKVTTSEEITIKEHKPKFQKLSELQFQEDSTENHGYKTNKPQIGAETHELKEEDQPKSLSEFSKDLSNTKKFEKMFADEKFGSTANTGKNVQTLKARDYDPIDPYTLKQILKRSNGTSLSEILQHHNLSLSDLLRGRGEAILALHTGPPDERKPEETSSETNNQDEAENKPTPRNQATTEQKPIRDSLDNDNTETDIQTEDYTNVNDTETDNKHVRNVPRIVTNRRFPTGIRRKLRMRPMLNSTLKAQLGRDLIALGARKYFNNNRNITKFKEWKDIIPVMLNKSKTNDETSTPEVTESTSTITEASADTTIPDLQNSNSLNSSSSDTENSYAKDNEVEAEGVSTTEATTTITIDVLPSETNTETDKPKAVSFVRPAVDASALRRQAFNNRLKRKRLKQRSSTTENPSDDLTKNFFGMANLVSASEFIERTQKPQTTVTQENTEFVTELEDFMTTHAPTTVEDKVKTIRITTSRYTLPSVTKSSVSPSTATTTEQSAKVEIEEILNDTMTSERLAKILRERNMTLSELVMHRERGSSHVHLADIFHNASKEPNPPEPFLTKSSIEPISKETYPLRAILEANTHDATARPTSQTAAGNYVHIPVVMDFGNNVNENGENMGIISLFKNNFENENIDKTEIRKDSHGTPYISSVISVNTTNANDTNRESRVLGDTEDIKGWNELLSLINKHNISTTVDELTSVTHDILPLDKGKITLEDDVDSDGLIILEDLQHLKDFDSNIASASDEKLEVRMYEASEAITEKPGILNKLPNNTRSVAIATASILGLATLLFLLTYIAFRYKQQKDRLRKKDSFCDERIPSPVFEHRKTHKNNCSSRSISPMISNSNIYTMSTLDSHNGKDSPDYMWNSLRKPFQ